MMGGGRKPALGKKIAVDSILTSPFINYIYYRSRKRESAYETFLLVHFYIDHLPLYKPYLKRIEI